MKSLQNIGFKGITRVGVFVGKGIELLITIKHWKYLNNYTNSTRTRPVLISQGDHKSNEKRKQKWL